MSNYQSKRAARSQLPPNVETGDKLRLVPVFARDSEEARPLPCIVESIPSHRRFVVIRFEAGFRECWRLEGC